MRHAIRLLGLTTLLLTVGTISAFAHGTSLKVDKATAAPGETITLKGEGITGGEIKLTLSGVQDYPLGTAKGDEHGRFEARVTLPADVRPGDYMVIAESGKRATAKLKVREGAPAAAAAGQDHTALPPASREHQGGMKGAGGMEGMEGMGEKHAEAGPMEVQRPGGAGEAAARWGIILGSVALGVLLRRGKRAREDETPYSA